MEEHVSIGKGKYRANLIAIITADGLIVSILGGEKPHVGAIAIGIPRPSLKPLKISATISVFTLVGHKDDEIAKPAAEKLAKELKQTTVVVSGVHVEKSNKEAIKKIKSQFDASNRGFY